MSQGDQKSLINQEEKDKMLDDLESLSQMLDEDLGDESEAQVIPEDIPVRKSFVDEVPVLNESADEEPPTVEPEAEQDDSEPPTLQASDSIDLNAASFNTHPAGRPIAAADGNLDMSFLDKDPLDISDRVRSYKQQDGSTSSTAASNPVPAAAPVKAEPPEEKKPVEQDLTKAEDVTRPLNRFQTSASTENPFLPRSTLDKIRENHAWEQNRGQDNDASAQLRKLLQDNPLNKVTFDATSKEAQALRQKASQLVNEVIRANMPRLEAELRMKLEQEVDRMFKEIKKNPH